METGSAFSSYQGKCPSLGRHTWLGSSGCGVAPRATLANADSAGPVCPNTNCPSSLDESTSGGIPPELLESTNGGGPDELLVPGLVFAGPEALPNVCVTLTPPGPDRRCIPAGDPHHIPGLTGSGVACAPAKTPVADADAVGVGSAAADDEDSPCCGCGQFCCWLRRISRCHRILS